MFTVLAGALTTGNIRIEANENDNAAINDKEALRIVGVRTRKLVGEGVTNCHKKGRFFFKKRKLISQT